MGRAFLVGERVRTIVDALQSGVPPFTVGEVVQIVGKVIHVQTAAKRIAVKAWQIRHHTPGRES